MLFQGEGRFVVVSRRRLGLANLLPNLVDIAMVDEESYIVNVNFDNNGEIMVPYSRVLYIAWDKGVGARLQNIRKERGLTRLELAALTNGAVSARTIIVLEGGERNSVSREKLDILLDVLRGDIRDLFPSVTIKSFE